MSRVLRALSACSTSTALGACLALYPDSFLTLGFDSDRAAEFYPAWDVAIAVQGDTRESVSPADSLVHAEWRLIRTDLGLWASPVAGAYANIFARPIESRQRCAFERAGWKIGRRYTVRLTTELHVSRARLARSCQEADGRPDSEAASDRSLEYSMALALASMEKALDGLLKAGRSKDLAGAEGARRFARRVMANCP